MAKTQRDKFEEAVRELGIDDADDAFEDALKKVANAPKLSDEEIRNLVKRQRDQAKR